MSLTTIRTQIKTLIEAVSGIGNVYDYERYCNDWATYKDIFVKNDKVNTWDIKRERFSSSSHGGSGGVTDRTFDFAIRGFYALNDALASEKTFQDLTDLVLAKFENNPDLNGIAHIVHQPIIGDFSIGKLGDVLVHIVTIHLSIDDRITS